MAILTMYKALPKREFPDKQLEHKLRLVWERQGSEFLLYDSEDGIWKFKVQGF